MIGASISVFDSLFKGYNCSLLKGNLFSGIADFADSEKSCKITI